MTLNRFDEISYLPLKVYNRVVFMNNLNVDGGEDAVKKYLEIFNEGEKRQIFLMQVYIQENGPEETKKEVMKGLEVIPDENVQE